MTPLCAMVLVALGLPRITAQDVQDICSFETFQAQCPSGHVVVMTQAVYGRMNLGRCVRADVGYVGCQADVMRIADSRCSGRPNCEVAIPDAEMDSTQPCLAELKMYLEASYTCQPVISPDALSCASCSTGKVLTLSSGTLASVTTLQLGCGSPDCPWIIQGAVGQRINITLMDYDVQEGPVVMGSSTNCRVYATLREPGVSGGLSATVCGGQQRERQVYLSTANVVEIRVVGQDNSRTSHYFMLTYKALGCPAPPIPIGGWSRRSDDSAILGCNGTTDTWVLRCVNDAWSGSWSNCSTGTAGVFGATSEGIHFPSGISILIILAISVALGILIFGIGIICLKKHRRHPQPRPERAHSLAPPPPPTMLDPYGKPIYATRKYSNPKNPSGVDRNMYPGGKERNEYTHIWQMPLPTPSHTESLPGYQGREHIPYDDYTPSIPSDNYESVPSGMGLDKSYGNNTLARQEIGQEFELENGEDPRYFQLDPDLHQEHP